MLINKWKLEPDALPEKTLNYLASNYELGQIIFFDIETTGFSAKSSYCYLIGCLYYHDESFHMIQWFSENEKEELKVLLNFLDFIQPYQLLFHFNGNRFDIPYLEQRLSIHKLPIPFDQFENIDIYQSVYFCKSLLQLENLKQKTVEQFLEYDRTDPFTGKELINIYLDYRDNPSTEKFKAILLHNREDLIGLFYLVPMLHYQNIFYRNYTLENCEVNRFKSSSDEWSLELIITATLPSSVPKKISYWWHDIYFTCYQNKLIIKIPVLVDELKYFYPNYKDYYYLPEEDLCIHKSVASYVDKNYRMKAKASTCYNKKTGEFLPQFEEVFTPYFKINYFDKITYFELTDTFLKESVAVEKYVNHILTVLK